MPPFDSLTFPSSKCLSLEGKSLALSLQKKQRIYLEKSLLEERVWKSQIEKPKLCILTLGISGASMSYVQAKTRACKAVGIESSLLELGIECTQEALLRKIEALNKDPAVHAILVQLPLPSSIDSSLIFDAIDPSKDVDGLHALNAGRVVTGDPRAFLPCTPKGIIRLLEYYKIPTKGKHCVIIGRSNIVGRPLSLLMGHRAWKGESSVTLLHSKSEKIEELSRNADILVVATGQREFLTKEYTKQGVCIVDVGIHKDREGKISGDVRVNDLLEIAGALTPVPGGVGPMTVAMLVENVLIAWARSYSLREITLSAEF